MSAQTRRSSPARTFNGVTYSRKLYSAWRNMIYRCENPRIASYRSYGARGVRVCDRWHSFEDFAKDMGEPPTRAHSIDRKNGLGNYEPSNCVWATKKEQGENRTLSIARKAITFGKLAAELGILPSGASHIICGRIGDSQARERTVAYFAERINDLIGHGWTITPHRIQVIANAANECGIQIAINHPLCTTRPSIAKSFGKRKMETV